MKRSASEKRTTSGQGTVRRVEGGDAAAPPGDSEETKARKDEEIDTDNVEALEKARNWDEFKDGLCVEIIDYIYFV